MDGSVHEEPQVSEARDFGLGVRRIGGHWVAYGSLFEPPASHAAHFTMIYCMRKATEASWQTLGIA